MQSEEWGLEASWALVRMPPRDLHREYLEATLHAASCDQVEVWVPGKTCRAAYFSLVFDMRDGRVVILHDQGVSPFDDTEDIP